TAVVPSASPPISIDWAQYHRDAGRSGVGPAEPALTTPRTAWNSGVDAEVYASPLIVAGHVIVATENNTVYSLDVFTGQAVQQLRAALSIGSGLVYVPFGGLFGDCGDYHGYVVGVPLSGGAAHVYRVPTATGASIWSPQGATIGPDGSVYVVTGNATSSASTFGYSDSVLQLSPDLASVRSY